jgi:hypothetical protein
MEDGCSSAARISARRYRWNSPYSFTAAFALRQNLPTSKLASLEPCEILRFLTTLADRKMLSKQRSKTWTKGSISTWSIAQIATVAMAAV